MHSSLVERFSDKEEVHGSIPCAPTNLKFTPFILMSEISAVEENPTFRPEEINEINLEIFRRLSGMFSNYDQIRRLLDKERVESEYPPAEIDLAGWRYTFKRNAKDYLDLTIIKKPLKNNGRYVDKEEIFDLIYSKDYAYGTQPLIRYNVNSTGELKVPPEINNPQAVKKTIALVSELEKRL